MSVKRRLAVLLLFFILLVPLLNSQAETRMGIFANPEISTDNNQLVIKIRQADHWSAYWSSTICFAYARIIGNLTVSSYIDGNGEEHPANLTISIDPDEQKWCTSGSGNKFTIFTSDFQDLRPSESAVSISGRIILQEIPVSSTDSFGNLGQYYVHFTEDGGWTATIYLVQAGEDDLVAVFGVVPQTYTFDFTVDFSSGNLSLSGGPNQGLPTEWQPIEGCGTPWIPKLGGFSVTYYASNPSTASSVLGRVADQIRSDSHNLSWIESFEIRDSVNFPQLAQSKNKTVSELVPADFSFYQHPTGGVTIIDVPSEINMGASGVAGPGIIFVYSPSEDILLHEIAHQVGWCDPDPYQQWKDYWNSYVMPETSQFTNETWYTKLSDTKLWVSLISDPICPASRTMNLVFSVRSSEDLTVAWEVRTSVGSVSPSSGTIDVTPEGTKFAVLFQPSPTDDLMSAYVELELSANGESRVFHFPLLIVPEKYGNVTLNSTAIPDYSSNYTVPDSYLQDLSNYYGQISTQLQDLIDANNYTKPEALQAAERAKMNLMKAQEDLQTAMQKNDTCVRNLLREAANYRQMASQYWLNYANYLQNTLNLGPISFSWTALSSTDIQNAKRMAQAYEQKAVSMEMQATFGCPSGILSAKSGLNPLIAFYSMLSSYNDQQSVVHLLYWGLLILGGVLFIIGILQAATSKRRNYKLILVGLALIFFALAISVFAGISSSIPFMGGGL